MKLARYTVNGATRIGQVVDQEVLDLGVGGAETPADLIPLICSAAALREIAKRPPSSATALPLSAVRLEAPIPNPSKYLAIGLNYRAHAQEASTLGVTSPKSQLWFNKQVSCINGPYDPIHMPIVSEQLDWEVELCVVIGTRCRHVTPDQAREVIGGYMVANDISVRDWQMMAPTWTLGKSFDTHGPVGPWLVTPDEIPDPHDLQLRLLVNGEERQAASTSQMIHSIYEQIAHLSTVMTLMPGDLIATGTPAGVGVAMKPPLYLKVGDVVRAEIDLIGHIEATVIREP